MLNAIFGQIADHWILSTYLSVMAVNESAILTAFSLVTDIESQRIVGLVLASAAGALTNDIILYVLARYGSERFFTSATREESESESFFERAFLSNTFLTLLCIKFLFGIRLFLTIYLVAKKRIPFGQFVAYDICGILLYVGVIGSLGLLVGRGNTGAENIYEGVVRIVTALSILLLIAHLVSRFLKKKVAEKKKEYAE
ncbi:MAG: hypothetical protein ACEQSB_02465 [Undibacterium sp.]